MKQKYFEINKEAGLIIARVRSALTADMLKKLKLSIASHKDFSPLYTFLLDIRDAQVLISNDDLLSQDQFLTTNTPIREIKQFAILTNSPEQVAKSLIYMSVCKERAKRHEVFSTLEASLKWLNVEPTKLSSAINSVNALSRMCSFSQTI